MVECFFMATIEKKEKQRLRTLKSADWLMGLNFFSIALLAE